MKDTTQISAIISHIWLVGKYTGLSLNVNKTVIFDLKSQIDTYLHGMLVTLKLVKYLGAFIGKDNLSHLNFDVTLQKARKIATRWNKRQLSLPGKVLVCKTYFLCLCSPL